MEQLWNWTKASGRRPVLLGQALLAGLAVVIGLALAFGSGDAAGQGATRQGTLLGIQQGIQQSSRPGLEMDLANNSQAWELNEDSDGNFWISDYQAGEIWQLNPATDVYTIYDGLSGASDGRLDANGDLWWADYQNYRFGRLELDSNTRTTWPLSGTIPGEIAGLNFDDQGRVWMPDSGRSDLFRFDPQSNQLCLYQLPNNSASYYVESHNGYLWLADWKLPIIYRIDPDDGSYFEWHYERASSSRGMSFDDDGSLWWGSFDGGFLFSRLFRLNPNSTFVTYYVLPYDSAEPAMVDAGLGFIWYSDYSGRFGRLDPDTAASSTINANTDSGVLDLVGCYPDWQPIGGPNPSVSTASAVWGAGTYTVSYDGPGWQSYELPADSALWGPWGIQARRDGIWLVDQERQKLVHVPWQSGYVPLIAK